MSDSSQLTPLAPNRIVDCFGCGANNPHGLRMTFSTDGVAVYSTVTVPRHLGGWSNLVHGGVLSTICDEIMGWTAMHLLQKMTLTKSMTVDFLKPVFITDVLKVTGRIAETTGPYQVLVEGEIRNHRGDVCVRSRGVFALLEPKTGIRMGILNETDARRFFASVFEPLSSSGNPDLPD